MQANALKVLNWSCGGLNSKMVELNEATEFAVWGYRLLSFSTAEPKSMEKTT